MSGRAASDDDFDFEIPEGFSDKESLFEIDEEGEDNEFLAPDTPKDPDRKGVGNVTITTDNYAFRNIMSVLAPTIAAIATNDQIDDQSAIKRTLNSIRSSATRTCERLHDNGNRVDVNVISLVNTITAHLEWRTTSMHGVLGTNQWSDHVFEILNDPLLEEPGAIMDTSMAMLINACRYDKNYASDEALLSTMIDLLDEGAQWLESRIDGAIPNDLSTRTFLAHVLADLVHATNEEIRITMLELTTKAEKEAYRDSVKEQYPTKNIADNFWSILKTLVENF